MSNLTDPKVFEPEWVEDPTHEHGGHVQSYQGRWLPGAHLVPDLGLVRKGDRAYVVLLRGGRSEELPQRYVVHSPTGFEWGYGGSGPADLALNVLGLFLPAPEAWRLHQDFKRDVVAGVDRDRGGVITATEVRDWIMDRWADEGEAVVSRLKDRWRRP